jgi:hypothetical protein
MRLVPALVAALVIAAGCGGGGGVAGGAHPRGWMTGVVWGGKPVCPTPTGKDSFTCHPTPLANGAFVVTGGGITRRVRADAKGRFRVALPPGRYAIRPGWSQPRRIRVRAGRVAHVRVGIRRPAVEAGGEG